MSNLFETKTTAIHEIIEERNLILTETWHGSSDDVSLHLAVPTGFSTVDAVRKSDPNHGGIVVSHRSRYRCVRVPLPELTSFEGMCVRLHIGDESVTLLSIYQPGSCRPSSRFLQRTEDGARKACPTTQFDHPRGRCQHPCREARRKRLNPFLRNDRVVQHDPTRRQTDSPSCGHTGPFPDTSLSQIVVDPAGMIPGHSLVTAF